MTTQFLGRPSKSIERLFAANRGREICVASGYISPRLPAYLKRFGFQRIRLLVGLDPNQRAVDQSLFACLRSLSRMETVTVKCIAGLHAKLYIVPGREFVCGSVNFSRSGFERLIEAGVRVTGAAATEKAHSEFLRWWKRGSPLSRVLEKIRPARRARGMEFEPSGRRGEQHTVSGFSNGPGMPQPGPSRRKASDMADTLRWAAPDPKSRQAVERLLASCIEVLPAQADRWEVTVYPYIVRLNIGPLTVIQVNADWVCVHVSGIGPRLRQRLLRLGGRIWSGFRSAHRFAKRPQWIGLPIDELDRVRGQLQPLVNEFARSVRGKTPFMAAHRPDAIAYLSRVTRRRLPDPRSGRTRNPERS